jgi:hypothetical protein
MRNVRNNMQARRGIRPARFSDIARCVLSGDLFQPSSQRKAKVAWIRGRELLTARVVGGGLDQDRSLCLVRTIGPTRISVCDSITGSLYSARTGGCYSSDCLRLEHVERDSEASARILLATKVEK